jgi:hypothetical protein
MINKKDDLKYSQPYGNPPSKKCACLLLKFYHFTIHASNFFVQKLFSLFKLGQLAIEFSIR